MITFNNFILVVKDRFYASNFYVIRDVLGLFNKNSHISSISGQQKVMHKTQKLANKEKDRMEEKTNRAFSTYKCLYCDGYHIGKNKY